MHRFAGFARVGAWIVAAAMCLTGSVARGEVSVGETAPPFSLAKILQGPAASEVNWKAFKGKVVVVDFWATWCGPCVESIPHWNALASAYREKPVVFIAITDENEDVVSAFLKKRPIQSWIGIDGVGRSMREAFGVRGIPTTFIVNQAGVVAAVTHPAKLEGRNIDEVIERGKSSLPRLEEGSGRIAATSDVASTNQLVVELSASRSAPRAPGSPFNMWKGRGNDVSGKQARVRDAIIQLFGAHETLVDVRTPLPTEEYDFKVFLPAGDSTSREAAVAAMFRGAFGLEIGWVEKESEVYVMTSDSKQVPGRILSAEDSQGGGGEEAGGFKLGRAKLSFLPKYFERRLRKPVLDDTGDTNRYDIRVRWRMSSRELLRSQIDSEVIKAVLDPGKLAEEALSAEQLRHARFALGLLAEAESHTISDEDRQGLLALRAEAMKPENERFLPDPEAVIEAAREQLGLKLTLEHRVMRILVVDKARSRE